MEQKQQRSLWATVVFCRLLAPCHAGGALAADEEWLTRIICFTRRVCLERGLAASGIHQNSSIEGAGSWRWPLIVMMIWGFRCTVGTGTHHELQRRDQHGKILVHHKQNDNGVV